MNNKKFHVRAPEAAPTNDPVIVEAIRNGKAGVTHTRDGSAGAPAVSPDPTKQGSVPAQPPVHYRAPEAAPEAPDAATAERSRVTAILGMSLLTDEQKRALVSDGSSLDKARELALRAAETPPGSFGSAHAVDNGDRVRALTDDVVHNRIGSVDLARACLSMACQDTSGDRLAILKRAQSTSDFTAVLSGNVGAQLRNGAEREPATHREWVFVDNQVTDFRDQDRPILGAAPDLDLKPELAPINHGAFEQDGTSFRVATYAKIASLSRETLVNDRLGAFNKRLTALGSAARRKEADLVYALLAENSGTGPTMQTGDVLFHSNHANIATGGMGVTGLANAKTLLRKAEGVGGGILGLVPVALVVPVEYESEAEVMLARASKVLYSSSDDVTPESLKSLKLIVEPRLDAAYSYLVCDPGQCDHITLGVLGGGGPSFEVRENFDLLSYEYRVVHDIGAKALDFRGIVRLANVA